MNLFLLFLSLTCGGYAPGCDADTAMHRLTADTVSMTVMQSCDFSIATDRAEISGLLVTRCDADGNFIGSLINEFGFSALDFSYNPARRKLKLVSITDFLDKWYIRRVISADLRQCLNLLYGIPEKPSRNYLIDNADDGTVILTNTKRKLTYRFSPLKPYNSNETAR